MSTSHARIPIGFWVVALGGTGFVAGFVGPMIFSPDANQGPLVGLLITGPAGAVAGLVLGVLLNVARVSRAVQMKILKGTCTLLGLGTLFYVLPEPARVADIIDATVAECSPPRELASEALAEWESAVARVTWHSPGPNWKSKALENLDRAAGVVLTMQIERQATVYRHRKPWNAGKLFISEWSAPTETKRYYASDEGWSCAPYLSRQRQLYMPFTDSPADAVKTGPREWPPTKVTSFLRLMELGPVPEAYRGLIQP